MGASEENKTPAYAALKLAGQLWTLRENGKLPQPQRAGAAGAGASEHAAKAPRVSFGGAAAPTPSPRERPGSAFGHASPPTAPSTRQGTPTAPPMRQVSSDELYAYITRNASFGVTEPELLRQFGEGYAKPLAALQEEGERLLVRGVKVQDAGNYECVLSTRPQKQQSHALFVERSESR